MTEYWLKGPVAGIAPLLQPVAHALLQARDDVAQASELTPSQLWTSPAGAAPVGYHLKHLAGSLDRLLTYARGETLSADQLASLKSESAPGDPPADAAALVALVRAGIDRALDQVRRTQEDSLLAERRVGRQGLLSNTLGLLFHAAEHTTRHVGQSITTAKIVKFRVESSK
jgi:hypothetical protein